jgi:hypothetical protein
MLRLRPRKTLASGIVIFLLLAGSLATNIVINTGQSVEFGQGSRDTVACDSRININFTSYIDTATANYLLKDVVVSDLSVQLHDKKVEIYLRDADRNPLNTALSFNVGATGSTFTSSYAHTDSIDATTAGAGPNAEMGRNAITFPNFRNSDSSTILAEKVKYITVQTSGSGDCSVPVITCANGGICAVGDLGPDGGVIVYTTSTPFTDTANNQQYRSIEVAPAYWYPGQIDPRTSICTTAGTYGASSLSNAIGAARTNTNAWLAVSACNMSTNGYTPASIPNGLDTAAKLVRNYGSDWNIPTLNELQLICKVARFGAALAPTITNCNDSGGSLNTAGWNQAEYVSSSKSSTAGLVSKLYMVTGGPPSTSAPQSSNLSVRPIRYLP